MDASEAGPSSGASGGEMDVSGSTVEIKIKTLDANTYTMRVNRDMPIPALKEELATLVGVAVANQRLICRGKVLKDDQLLSSYNVEDGHTLHLVVRPPQQPPSTATGGASAAGEDGSGPSDPALAPSLGRSGHVSHSVLMGTINIPDGEGPMPDLNRIISAVLTSVGLGNGVTGNLGGNNAGSAAAGVLPVRGQQGASDGHAGLDSLVQAGAAGVDQQFEFPLHRDLELQIDALYGPAPSGGSGGAAGLQPMRFAQPPVIPDALTTMSQYLDRLEQGFAANEGIASAPGGNSPSQQARPGGSTPEGGTGSGVTAPPAAPVATTSGPVARSVQPNPSPGGDGQEITSTSGHEASNRRLPTPAALGALVRRVQNLLNGGAGTALSRLAGQLESEPSMNDPGLRAEVQATALRDGSMIQQLGALLLELGRTTQTVRMGQSPAESAVNAGPAVFISPTGPNPMMIQPLAYIGAMPLGSIQLNGGVSGPAPGPSLGPRSNDIHIQTSDLGIASESPSSSPSPSTLQQQPASRTLVGISSGAPSLTMRQFFERVEAANGGHTGIADPGGARPTGADDNLSMRQLIERAAEYRAQAGNADQTAQGPGASGGHMQGAIMTFEDNGAVRVHPVRTRPTSGSGGAQRTVSGTIHTRVASENGGVSVHHPFVARLRDNSPQVSQRSPGTGPSPAGGSGISPQSETPVLGQQEYAVPQPTFRAQIHVQGLGGQGVQSDGISFSLGPSPSGELRVQQAPLQQGPVDARAGSGGAPPDAAAPSAGSGNRDVAHGGVDIMRLIGSVGPFLRHMAEAYSRSSPRQPNEQTNPGEANQVNLARGDTNVRETAAEPERSELQRPRVNSEERGVDQPSNNDTVEHMEVDVAPVRSNGVALSATSDRNPSVDDAAMAAEPGHEVKMDTAKDEENAKVPSSAEEGHAAPPPSLPSVSAPDSAPAPVGLGLGALQPLPARPRRRSQGQRHQQIGNYGLAGAGPLSSGNLGQNGVQTPGAQHEGSVARLGDQNASENTLGRFSDLPFSNGVRNRGDLQNGTARGEADRMNQLMSGSPFGGMLRANVANGDAATMADSGGIAGIMGQLMRSPLVENIVHQVMESMGDDESQHLEEAMASMVRGPTRGGEGNLDLGGMLQQVIPVVSQMLGGRSPGAVARQTPIAVAAPESGAQGGASAAATADDWKEALSQEEAASWNETLSADVSRQQSMPPQRPFSDVYARGSPVAKRQKTDLEGTAQKLENGEPAEDVLKSMAENAVAATASSNGTQNGVEASEFAQHIARTEGLADAYMAVLSHDLAARVAADPDFGDGSRFPNAVRVLKQSPTSKKPAGGRQ